MEIMAIPIAMIPTTPTHPTTHITPTTPPPSTTRITRTIPSSSRSASALRECLMAPLCVFCLGVGEAVAGASGDRNVTDDGILTKVISPARGALVMSLQEAVAHRSLFSLPILI